MFIELIDRLRCTNPHDETWLVGSFTERRDRFIRVGTLGCHICQREYPIVDGVAYFGVEPGKQHDRMDAGSDSEMPMRAAALLNASEGATLVLAGSWAPYAHAVAEIVPVRIFALNPTAVIDEAELIATIESSEGIPLATRSVDGVALDDATATPAMLVSALRVLKPGGRLAAPVHVAIPDEIVHLASDDVHWVGETVRDLVSLQRG
jgi:uncharacterized protein YbaR (Trm112 family)